MAEGGPKVLRTGKNPKKIKGKGAWKAGAVIEDHHVVLLHKKIKVRKKFKCVKLGQ